MPRLQNKGFTAVAPQTTGSIPEMPDFSPEFVAAVDGAQETNASLQRWWDLVKQRIEFNSGRTNQSLFQLKAQFTSGDASLAAEITEERVVRADADTALAFDILTVSATVDGLSATVSTLASALATAEGYLEARWTINVSAGPIVTGMTLFSASGPDTDISYVAFQADRFQINTASGGNKLIFSATATEVKLGSVLTVDLASTKLFIGTGTYANANTYFYVDTVGGGRMSLGSKFVWDGSALTLDGTITATAGAIGGWTIASTTLSASNVVISSTGTIALGTANDILILSAADSTFRLWAGNASSGSASFTLTKTGIMTATNGVFSGSITSTSGTIGGFAIGSTSLIGGSGTNQVQLFSDGFSGVVIGDPSARRAEMWTNASVARLSLWSGSGSAFGVQADALSSGGTLKLYAATATPTITLDGVTGTVTASSFAGSGASLTSLNASNISNGTLNNARLSGVTLNANNLSDLSSASSARGNLGLGSIATQNANGVAITGGSVYGCTSNGFVYDSIGGANRIALLWDGANVKVYVDGSVQGTIPNP